MDNTVDLGHKKVNLSVEAIKKAMCGGLGGGAWVKVYFGVPLCGLSNYLSYIKEK